MDRIDMVDRDNIGVLHGYGKMVKAVEVLYGMYT